MSRSLRLLLPVFATVMTVQGLIGFEPTEDGLYAVFDTTEGEFTARLHYEKVPMTVANFVGLAENSISHFDDQADPMVARESNFYDGLIFHRVDAGFVIQAGSPLGNGRDGPGYTFPDEIDPTLKHDKKGVLSMANSGPNTNGSQFFITLAETSGLDGLHAVFGEVVEGISVVDSVGVVAVDPSTDKPLDDVVINSVTIIREGSDAEAFMPTDYQNPFSVGQLSATVEFTESQNVVTSFERRELGDYFVQSSPDMVNWGSPRRLFSDENDGTRVVHNWVQPNGQGDALFYRYTELEFPWAQSKPGSVITVSLPVSFGGDHILTLGENGRATFVSGSDSGICGYAWYDLGERIQFQFIVFYANNNYYQAQAFFKKSDLNSGAAFLRIRNVLPGRNPEDGTFETTFEFTP